MTKARRTMLIKALGLVGIQATPEISEIMIEIYEHIVKHGDISLGDITSIEQKVDKQFPKDPPPLPAKKEPGRPGPRVEK